MKRLVASFLAFAFVSTRLFAQSDALDYGELNERIFDHLELLDEKGRDNRHLSGGFMIGLGALSALGGYLIYTTPSYQSELSKAFSYSLMGVGALYAGIGIPVLLIPSKEEKAFARYKSYADRDDKRKFELGERDFRDLAEDRRMGRLAGGGSTLAMGMGYVLVSGTYYGAALVGVGLAGLLVDSPAEREWKIYQEEKGRMME